MSALGAAGQPAFNIQSIGLSTYSAGGYADSSVVNLIDRAVANGANQVVLSNIVLADLKTGAISDVVENGFNQTASLADVGRAIGAAHAAGLEVMLKPQIAVHDPAFDQYNSASWINMVNPDLVISDPAAFFSNYKAMLLQWATLAEQNDVRMLSIGNEMVAATKPQYTAYWNDIIDAVRGVYHGDLTYAALAPVQTNSPSNEITQIGFWSKLDFAGFDVYPSLVHTTTPAVADLAAGWHDATVFGQAQDYVSFLNHMAAAVGKPVIFTETGLPSFDGASDRQATSDGDIGAGTHATDQQEQADWWQAFFQTWAVDPPQWLKGVVVVNNDPGGLGAYYDQNYNINGKLAEQVVTAWFGGATTVDPTASALHGGQADDQLFLYGPTSPHAASQAQSLTTAVSFKLTGSILDGTAPVIRTYINGVDHGVVALKPLDSGYVNGEGVHFTTDQTFTIHLAGLVPIEQLKIVLESPATVAGHRPTTFFHSAEVDGVALQNATYVPAPGNGGPYAESFPVGGVGGSVSQWGGGYLTLDATPWNAALATRTVGDAAHPIRVDGMGGVDVVHVLGSPDQYTLVRADADNVRLIESSGLGQNAILTKVAAVSFADGTLVALGDLKSGVTYQFHAAPPSVADPIVLVAQDANFAGAEDAQIQGRLHSTGATGGAALPGVLDIRVTATDPGASASDVFVLNVAQTGLVLNGSGASERLTGGAGDDRIAGGGGADTLSGLGGDDWLAGGANPDYLDGGAGVDTVSYAAATSRVSVSLAVSGAQKTRGGGKDTLVSIENLQGSSYGDRLTGNAGANVLDGGGGADTLVGGGGADRLVGGAGADRLVGGAGADRFVFLSLTDSTPDARDAIADFRGAEGDRIDLSAIDAIAMGRDDAFRLVSSFSKKAGELTTAYAGDHYVVQGDVDGNGVADFAINVYSPSALSQSDFLL